MTGTWVPYGDGGALIPDGDNRAFKTSLVRPRRMDEREKEAMTQCWNCENATAVYDGMCVACHAIEAGIEDTRAQYERCDECRYGADNACCYFGPDETDAYDCKPFEPKED